MEEGWSFGCGPGLELNRVLVLFFALLLASGVTLGKSHNLSGPLFFVFKIGVILPFSTLSVLSI